MKFVVNQTGKKAVIVKKSVNQTGEMVSEHWVGKKFVVN